MSAPTIEPEAPAPAPEVEEYRPHRKWFQRPDVVAPLLLVLFAFVLLITTVEEPGTVRTRMRADGETSFDWMYFWHLMPLMWQGLLVLAKATVLGFMISASLGFLLALGRRSKHRVVRWPVALVIEFIRSTPLLVQLFFLLMLVRATDAISFSPLTILVIGLGVHYATYCSEAYRAGINSVDQGQWEAATALNLGPVATWTRVVIPQAVPNVLPALGNFLVAAFKDAPMGFILNVHCLLFFANSVRSSDFRAVEPYVLAGVGFLLVSIPAAWAVRKLEKRIEYERI